MPSASLNASNSNVRKEKKHAWTHGVRKDFSRLGGAARSGREARGAAAGGRRPQGGPGGPPHESQGPEAQAGGVRWGQEGDHRAAPERGEGGPGRGKHAARA